MRMMRPILVVLAMLIPAMATAADLKSEVVSIGGVQAILMTPAKPHGAIVLMSGGDGEFAIDAKGETASNNSLVRNRAAFAARGFAVLSPEGNIDVTAAVTFMRTYGHVTLAGTSRGTQRAARGIAAGARPDRLVLTSGFLSNASGDSDNVIAILGSPALLPPTLVVHNRQDGCNKTLPAGVEPFMAWAGAKARLVWLQGGTSVGNPCQSLAYHGFNGIDGPMVGAVAGFALH